MTTRNPQNGPESNRLSGNQAQSRPPQSAASPTGPSSAVAKERLRQRSSRSNRSTQANKASVSSALYASAPRASTDSVDVASSDEVKHVPARPYVPKANQDQTLRDISLTESSTQAESSPGHAGAQQQRLAVNAAFMWEIKSVNEDLWLVIELLQALCRRPHLISQRGKRLVGLLEQLLDLVAMQFTLEEAYGYFDDPEHVEPAFSTRAVGLRDEHVVLYESLMALVDRAQEFFFEGDSSAMTYRLPVSINAFVEQFQAHDRRECELTMIAANVDLGVGD